MWIWCLHRGICVIQKFGLFSKGAKNFGPHLHQLNVESMRQAAVLWTGPKEHRLDLGVSRNVFSKFTIRYQVCRWESPACVRSPNR